MIKRLPIVIVCLWLQSPATGQKGQAAPKAEPAIQDNSFLIEEAYNQEHGVVQHISTFTRLWNSKDWSYSFTQEWPLPGNWRHQFSYTLVGMHAGGYSGTGVGLGDAAFHYRYQLIGDGDSRFAFAPRMSLQVPLGSVEAGRGAGAVGVQTNLPFSVVLHRRLVAHWNGGSTWIPHAQDALGHRASSVGYSVGQGLVYLASPRVNLMLEMAAINFQTVTGDGGTEWSRVRYVSPGVRWAYNLKNGLQIVPGAAMPIGFAGSSGERGVFLYLSLEHPFGK
ncbi:MAG: hypothetical protein JWP63_146 [Candidatus Solibacter sp.]|nr:hypothetical protein [Candidatus Solibacter sp.]